MFIYIDILYTFIFTYININEISQPTQAANGIKKMKLRTR